MLVTRSRRQRLHKVVDEAISIAGYFTPKRDQNSLQSCPRVSNLGQFVFQNDQPALQPRLEHRVKQVELRVVVDIDVGARDLRGRGDLVERDFSITLAAEQA